MSNPRCVSSPRPRSLRLNSLVLLFLALPALPAAQGQVTFNGAQQTLASFSSTFSISPVAVDAAGDSFFATTDGSTNALYEVAANGAQTTLSSGFPFFPLAIAVNPQGTSLYFVYYGAITNCSGVGYSFVATAPVSPGTTPVNLPCSFSFSGVPVTYSDPAGLATDGAGNLFVADFGGAEIFAIAAPAGATSVPSKYVALAQEPWDLAVAPNGNIYFTALDPASSIDTLYTVAPGALGATASAAVTPAVGLAVNLPDIQSGLSVDKAGDVYLGGGASATVKFSGNALVPVFAGFAGGASGLGTDAAGNLFVAGVDGSGIPRLVEINFQSVRFGSRAIGAAGSPLALNFTIGAGTNVGSIKVLNTGNAYGDFFNPGSSTCAVKTYATTSACAVNVNFKALAPGVRRGAVVFSDTFGNPLAAVPVYGNGTGPQQAAAPGAVTAVVNGLNAPYGITVDSAGNIFIADDGNARVLKIAGGMQSTVGSGLVTPLNVAVDGAGNVFVSDLNTQGVWQIAPSGAQIQVVGGIAEPFGLAIDGPGNLYVADLLGASVLKVTPSGAQSAVGSGFSEPAGIAIDAVGNLFISDIGTGRVYEVTPAGIQAIIATGLVTPASLAVDSAGNVNVAVYGSSQIIQIAPGGAQTTVLGNLKSPFGVALDSAGNLFYTDTVGSAAGKITRSVLPTLKFLTTPGGSSSADSPQTVSLANIGNAPLNFSALSYPLDFPADSSGSATACTPTTKLLSGAACTFTVDFKPVSVNTNHTPIALAEQIKFTNNNLNTAAAASQINVSGLETKLIPTLKLSVTSAPGSSTIVVVARITGSGPVPTGAVTFYAGSTQIGSALNLSGGVAGFYTARPAQAAVITAVYAGNAVYAGANSNGILVAAAQDTPTVTLTSNVNPALIGSFVTFTASLGNVITGVPPLGTVSFYSNGALLQTTPLSGTTASYAINTLSSGTRTITAVYSGDSNYVPTTSNALSQTITKATTVATLTSSPDPALRLQTVTFTIKASTTLAGQVPTGTVQFKAGGGYIGGAVALVNGQATLTTSALGSGITLVTAIYSGDANYLPVNSNSLNEIVNKNATISTLASSANPATVGTSVTFTVSLSITSLGTPPSGSVTFLADGKSIGTGTLSGGVASLSTAALTVGTHTILATYAGDANYLSVNSNAVSQVITH